VNAMSLQPETSAAAYAAALADYLTRRDEALLARAYELGRAALAAGCSIPELVGLHKRSLQSLLTRGAVGRDTVTLLDAAGDFLAEALSPFEMTHRGYRDSLIAWRHINETLEKEIRRIAHALHDESGQLLVSLHLQLAQLARELPAAAQHVHECQQLLHRVEQELRRLSHELRPTVLDDLGWLPAIEFLAGSVSARTQIPIEVRSGVTARLRAEVETALYRVVQEALTNATRHARARRIRIEITQERERLHGVISDDGVGFDAAAGASGGGLGLKGMHERLDALGGSLRVVSAPGRGAEVRFQLPMS
jgi:signal transduction histidine kinase